MQAWRKLLRLSFRSKVAAVVVLGGLLYVGNYLTPSSYALTLRRFKVADDGLLLGTPREYRTDEFAVATSMLQASLRNDGERINHTSYYREDLRSFLNLPLKDWALVFKPLFWPFFVVDAAIAYSFFNYAILVGFLVGYAWMFVRAGSTRLQATLASMLLFSTSWSQNWWTTFGQVLGLFPWVVITFMAPNRWWKWPLFYWVSVVWLLVYLYPPVMITLAFATVFYLLAFHRPFAWRDWAIGGGVAGAAVGTVAFYLWDCMVAYNQAVYPGDRRVEAGTEMGVRWLSLWFPSINIDLERYVATIKDINICEIGTVGSFFPTLVLFFVDYSKVRSRPWRETVLLLAPLLLMFAWMLLPLPSIVGELLLWTRVPMPRMYFGAGLLLTLLALHAGRIYGLKLQLGRALSFSLASLWAWDHFKNKPDMQDNTLLAMEFAMAAVVMLCWLLKRWVERFQATQAIFLTASVVVGVCMFGRFNPVQSAWPMFHHESTQVTQLLDKVAASNDEHMVWDEYGREFMEGELNGWGYKSRVHFVDVPQVPFFLNMYPQVPTSTITNLANRCCLALAVSQTNGPGNLRLVGDNQIVMPVDPRYSCNTLRDVRLWDPSGTLDPAVWGMGAVENVGIDRTGRVSVRGWTTAQHLAVHTPLGFRTLRVDTISRMDVALAIQKAEGVCTGYLIRGDLSNPGLKNEKICVVAEDHNGVRRPLPGVGQAAPFVSCDRVTL